MTHPALCISEKQSFFKKEKYIFIKVKINIDFYFHTSLLYFGRVRVNNWFDVTIVFSLLKFNVIKN